MVAGGQLAESEAREALASAAKACGLDEAEIPGTLSSGMEAGKREPRTAPPRTGSGAPAPANDTSYDHLDALMDPANDTDEPIALPDRISAGRYVDVLTGREHAIGTDAQRLLSAAVLLEILPWCVLVRQEER